MSTALSKLRPRYSIMVASLVVASSSVARGSQTIDVETSSNYRAQKFEAWGTSLAWWSNEAGGWSPAGSQNLSGLLFDGANSLGLNFVRYNIGGGQNPALGLINRPGSNIEGWVPNAPSDISDPATWQWDFDADATQRSVLNQALAQGVTQVEAFANSAPWWMTRSQDVTGSTAPNTSNLSLAVFDEFAVYLTEVTQHFEENLGVHFGTLAPLNEPGSGFWNAGGNQEGMNIPKGLDQALVYEALSVEAQARGLNVGLVGPEETSVTDTVDSWENPGFVSARPLIDQINTHTYPFRGGSDGAVLSQLQAISHSSGKPLYATEFGTGSGALDGGIELARRITTDLTALRAQGWTYWQALEDNNGSGWGLLIEDFAGSEESPTVRHQYQVMRQFTSNIRPGAHILTDSDEESLLAYDPRTDSTTIVYTQQGAGNGSRLYNLLDKSPEFTRLIRTSALEGFESLGPAAVSGSHVTVSELGDSVSTVVVHHQPNLLTNAFFALDGEPGGTATVSGWRATDGGAAFFGFINNSADSTGAGVLFADNPVNQGTIRHDTIGDGTTDLTGVAYEFSLDVLFQNQGSSFYDAETYLGIEFLGQDGETLTYSDAADFETIVEPSIRTGSSVASDSVYRVYRTDRLVAPEGTRSLRPVIGYRDVGTESTDWVYVDSAYLQEVHPLANGREWRAEGTGLWSDRTNWLDHALVERNDDLYFGNSIAQDATVLLTRAEHAESITFFSDHSYRIFSSNQTLSLGVPVGDNYIDVRRGDHRVSVATVLEGDTTLRVLPGSSAEFDTGLNVNGHVLRKTGDGTLSLAVGFALNGGRLASFTTDTPRITLGEDAILNGEFRLLAAPGQAFSEGDVFGLIDYASGFIARFDSLILPQLDEGLAWETSYDANEFSLSVVTQTIDSFIDGDYDGSGFVSQSDLDLVLLNWGSSVLPPGWLATNQKAGSISQDELDRVLLNWGNSVPPVGRLVPEPRSIALIVLGLGVTLIRRPLGVYSVRPVCLVHRVGWV